MCRSHNLAPPHNPPSTDDCADGPTLHFDAVIGRPLAATFNPFIGNGFPTLHVNNGEIRIITFGNTALACNAKNALWAMRGEINEALKCQSACVYMVQHDGHQCLHASHAGGGLRIGFGFFLQRVRRMV